MRKYLRFIICTGIWFLLFCLPVSTFAADKVTLQLIWKNQFQFAGYYVAKELGLLRVRPGWMSPSRSMNSVPTMTEDVISRKAHFGVGQSSLILERMEGKPVYLLSAIFQHSPFMAVVPKTGRLKRGAPI